MKYLVWYLDGQSDYRTVTFRKNMGRVCRYGRWIELVEERGQFRQAQPIDFNDGVGRISVAEQTRLAAHAAINVNSVAEHLGMRA